MKGLRAAWEAVEVDREVRAARQVAGVYRLHAAPEQKVLGRFRW